MTEQQTGMQTQTVTNMLIVVNNRFHGNHFQNHMNEDDIMKIAGTLPFSVVNGCGIRYVVFVQGCSHHCKGCHNPDTWDFEGGVEKSVEEIAEDFKKMKFRDGITLSGGDPFFQQEECLKLPTGRAFLKAQRISCSAFRLREAFHREELCRRAQ